MKEMLKIKQTGAWTIFLFVLAVSAMLTANAFAFTVTVVDPAGVPVPGFRWLLEEDNTNVTVPGVPARVTIGTDIHNSHAPLVSKGTEATATADITTDSNGTPLPDIRYVVSILPDAGFSNSGTVIEPGQGAVTVTVNPLPIPTAQISLFAFVDHNPINNVFDEHDLGLGGASIIISDNAGPVSQDAFGNPLGTQYDRTCDDTYAPATTGTGTFPCVDPIDGPVVTVRGSGSITTLTQEQFNAGGPDNPYNLKVGEALIKYLVPGKYGIVVVPPGTDDNGSSITWSQTSTIEGTPTVDAWVKANEPKLFVEGFGTGFNHVFYGFVKVSPLTPSPFKGQTFTALEWNVTPPTTGDPAVTATGSISGTLRMNHFSKPPNLQGFFPGVPVANCWVGLNDPLVQPGLLLGEAGKYAVPCNADSSFTINNVPPGTYQLVTWDTYLDTLFGIHSVTVPPGASGTGEAVDLGNVLTFRWFGTLNNYVFFDTNENGFRDPGEPGIPEQNVNIRFRDGTIYQAFPTDLDGFVPFDEVFPFFKWLVVEVDFARFKATGMTTAVDDGGAIPGPAWPANGNKNPQPQPENGGADYRTETGPVLTQAMHLFLGQTNLIEWGKSHYADGENGGISGIVFYAVTRAENDPRYAAAEEWEPGVPRVQVNLYRDQVINASGLPGSDKMIDDVDNDGFVVLADVDNYPFDWYCQGEISCPGTPGPEDVDDGNTGVDIGSGNGIFDAGDAIQITTTDSWDDNKPSGCVQDLPLLPGLGAINECADNFGTWNQVRPGLFDGGYAFDSYYPGGDFGSPEAAGLPSGFYIVEAVTPPGYELLKEEDRNVDFGDEYIPSTLLLPAECVGAGHLVPATLSFDNATPAPFAGDTRPLCDRKLVSLSQGQNAAADFFLFTQVPKAARAVGFANNDLGAEFNQASPIYGEKLAASWLPVSFTDWQGKELVRVYTDEFGAYNAMLPSTYTVNVPSPTGVSPSMITLILNDPYFEDGTPDPFHDPDYAITPWTFNYMPGATSYLDTPIIPVTAFTASERRIDTGPFNGTPVIYSASTAGLPGPDTQAGPLFCTDTSPGDATNYGTITINAPPGGFVDVRNPDYPTFSTIPTVSREVGFGVVQGTNGAVTLDGVALEDIVSWENTQIVANVPVTAATGQLMVIRDNGTTVTTSEIGLTLSIMDCSGLTVHTVTPAAYPVTPIQDAVDAAVAGDIILVSTGTYNENVIVDKPVWIQGSGTGTKINANPIPLDRIDLWHDRLETDAFGGLRFVSFLLKNPLSAAETPAFFVVGETEFPTGNLQAPGGTTQFLNPGNPFPGPGQQGIDGFYIFGARSGGGIYALSGVRDFTISNNEIINNQGNFGGGIGVGTPDSGFPVDAQTPTPQSLNYGMVIRNNKIHRNGGVQGGGGIAMNEGSEGYLIEDNIITGNFGRFNGGGIQHRGFSAGDNIIRSNRIIFNEVFFGVILAVAGDGAGIYIGGDVAGGTGSGNVTIDSNLIQGNMTGAGNGGGIRGFAINGDDVRDSPGDDTNWFTLDIFNNIIVNNIAGNSGAGISLQDAPRVNIVNNTIARNDSTATSVLNFEVGQANSTPTPAGVASNLHSTILYNLISPMSYPNYSDPLLVNNIIRQNRSFYNDASLNSGAGGLAANPAGAYWDIHVIGAVSDADPHLNPDYCMLTSLTDPATGFDYTLGGTDTTNNTLNPAFLAPYFNTIESATVVDEGGNAINLRFTPLLSAGTNYHVGQGFGWEAGTNAYLGTFGELALDFDRELRPFGAGISDIGADELQALPAAPAGLTGGVKGVTAQVTEVVQTNLQTGSLSGVSATLPGTLASGESGSLLDRAKETLAGVIDAIIPERNHSGSSGTGLGESVSLSPETENILRKESDALPSATRQAPVLSTEQNVPVGMNLRLPADSTDNVLQNTSGNGEGFGNELQGSLASLQESSGAVRDVSQQAPLQASMSTDPSETVLSGTKGRESGSGAGMVTTATGQDEASGSGLFRYILTGGLLLVGLVLISFVFFLPRAKKDREQQKRGEI